MHSPPRFQTSGFSNTQNSHDAIMPKCETCGNEYDKAFIVEMNNERHTFDSFECAIQRLAPTCKHCECRIIGHGVEAHGTMYCCAHCAKGAGEVSLKDRS